MRYDKLSLDLISHEVQPDRKRGHVFAPFHLSFRLKPESRRSSTLLSGFRLSPEWPAPDLIRGRAELHGQSGDLIGRCAIDLIESDHFLEHF